MKLSREKNKRDFRVSDPALWEPAQHFYGLALERDRAMFRNLDGQIKKSGSKTAVVIAGGFHLDGFKEQLQKAGCSYLVVRPAMKSLAGRELYPDLMRGRVSYAGMLKDNFYDALMHASLPNSVATFRTAGSRK